MDRRQFLATATMTGTATLTEQRTYQLVRQQHPITDRTCTIEFLDPGVEVYCFTFG